MDAALTLTSLEQFGGGRPAAIPRPPNAPCGFSADMSVRRRMAAPARVSNVTMRIAPERRESPRSLASQRRSGSTPRSSSRTAATPRRSSSRRSTGCADEPDGKLVCVTR